MSNNIALEMHKAYFGPPDNELISRQAAIAALRDCFKFRSDILFFEAERAIESVPNYSQHVTKPLVWEQTGAFSAKAIAGAVLRPLGSSKY